MKNAILAGLIGFGATLAVVIGGRLPVDAAEVVTGVFVGIVASVPVALALIAVLRRPA